MARHIAGPDWDLANNFKARRLVTDLRKALPGAWSGAVEILSVSPADTPIWMRSGDWVRRLEAFKKAHAEAGDWAQIDIDKKSKELAAWSDDLLDLKGPHATDTDKVDKVRIICDLIGVDTPDAITATGAANRIIDPIWWRRVLRRKVARIVEAGAIKLGLVNRRDGGYCSQSTIKARRDQQARNEAMLKRTLLRNEAGQVYTLADLAKTSTANPEIRGGELMVRIRGCEEYADSAGHVGYFLTGTCPSKYHAIRVSGKGRWARVQSNPSYDGISTPRDAQCWLRDQWARTRAQWARDGIKAYGFRVAEPHHDGTPHWHLLMWFESEIAAFKALSAFGRHWLSDGGAVQALPDRADVVRFVSVDKGHEKGALKNRINIKRLMPGGAAGYVAKYVAKSIGHFDVGVQLDQAGGKTWEVDTRESKGWQRVDAWAACWGIRQFQSIGQPPVTVWREIRRVTQDQIDTARLCGDKVASSLWHAARKVGAVGADWARYITHQGGVCLKRTDWRVQSAKRINEGHINAYGESITQKRVIGCELASGRVLVSRRQKWVHVGADVGVQDSAEREALGAPWTRFNNCTARIGHDLRAALHGLRSASEFESWGYLDELGPRCGT